MKNALVAFFATLTVILATLLYIVAIYCESIRHFLIVGSNTGSDWCDKE